MLAVGVVVELNVSVKPGDTPAKIEGRIDAEGKRASSEVYISMLSESDDKVVKTKIDRL